MISRGVYAAGLSVINDDLSLNINATIKHAENIIKKGLHGVFFFRFHRSKSIDICL